LPTDFIRPASASNDLHVASSFAGERALRITEPNATDAPAKSPALAFSSSARAFASSREAEGPVALADEDDDVDGEAEELTGAVWPSARMGARADVPLHAGPSKPRTAARATLEARKRERPGAELRSTTKRSSLMCGW
jgi:hypothetical protein